ncbi:MAG: hypothetical protein U0N15_03590 [Bifidobacterium choerinum]
MDNKTTNNDDTQATPATTTQGPQATPEPEEHSADEAQQSGDGQLGEGGLKALRAERAARKAAEAQAKEQQKTFDERLQALEAENARMKAERFERRVTDAASGKLKTPALALKLADVSADMTDAQLGEAIDKLLKDCPELAVAQQQGGGDDPFRFANHANTKPQNAHDMNALAFANMMRDALNH